jgi:hypothetical protein
MEQLFKVLSEENLFLEMDGEAVAVVAIVFMPHPPARHRIEFADCIQFRRIRNRMNQRAGLTLIFWWSAINAEVGDS